MHSVHWPGRRALCEQKVENSPNDSGGHRRQIAISGVARALEGAHTALPTCFFHIHAARSVRLPSLPGRLGIVFNVFLDLLYILCLLYFQIWAIGPWAWTPGLLGSTSVTPIDRKRSPLYSICSVRPFLSLSLFFFAQNAKIENVPPQFC